MNVLDYIIVVLIILCGLLGFKKGILNSVVTFSGFIIIVVFAFYLKNFLSVILYDKLPFINFTGTMKGLKVYNVLVYEGLSFLITLFLLTLILSIILKLTGILNRIINSTIILGLPSKILGALFGLVEGYIFAFIITFALNVIIPSSSLVSDSKYTDMLITKTPLLSDVVSDTYNSVTEVFTISKKYNKEKDKTKANNEALKVLLKYEIISPDAAESLVESGKFDFDGAEDVISKYRKEQK